MKHVPYTATAAERKQHEAADRLRCDNKLEAVLADALERELRVFVEALNA